MCTIISNERGEYRINRTILAYALRTWVHVIIVKLVFFSSSQTVIIVIIIIIISSLRLLRLCRHHPHASGKPVIFLSVLGTSLSRSNAYLHHVFLYCRVVNDCIIYTSYIWNIMRTPLSYVRSRKYLYIYIRRNDVVVIKNKISRQRISLDCARVW